MLETRPPLTKILATLGPASEDPKTLAKLVEAGARNFRLNFSHGNFDDHARRLNAVRQVERELGIALTVLGDLPGPKIRIGTVPAPGIELVPGQDVWISATATESRPPTPSGDWAVLSCTYPDLAREVLGGHRVLINDGAVRMLAVDSDGTRILCRVTVGGLVTSKKGLNLPDSNLSVPAVTERDIDCALWGLEHGVDYLALSFVRRGDDVRQLAEVIHDADVGRDGVLYDPTPDTPLPLFGLPIIAKIETPQAVANIDDILLVADGIMVARGDLGVELDLAQVPVVQKRLVERAHDYGKPCIVATQMLESMIEHASATRAEVSDVANAILDGADAVMLSGETAVGKYPLLAVDTMRRVALATEDWIRSRPTEERPPALLREQKAAVPALAHGAWVMYHDTGATVVTVWSQTGGTARSLSRNGFRVPILAYSTDERAVRRMNLLYAVFPFRRERFPVHRFEFAQMVDRSVLEGHWASRGDTMILLAGFPFNKPGGANTVAIRRVGDLTPDHVEGDG